MKNGTNGNNGCCGCLTYAGIALLILCLIPSGVGIVIALVAVIVWIVYMVNKKIDEKSTTTTINSVNNSFHIADTRNSAENTRSENCETPILTTKEVNLNVQLTLSYNKMIDSMAETIEKVAPLKDQKHYTETELGDLNHQIVSLLSKEQKPWYLPEKFYLKKAMTDVEQLCERRGEALQTIEGLQGEISKILDKQNTIDTAFILEQKDSKVFENLCDAFDRWRASVCIRPLHEAPDKKTITIPVQTQSEDLQYICCAVKPYGLQLYNLRVYIYPSAIFVFDDRGKTGYPSIYLPKALWGYTRENQMTAVSNINAAQKRVFSDTTIITRELHWQHERKDGYRDLRYKNNESYCIFRYIDCTFTLQLGGISLEYFTSSKENCDRLEAALKAYSCQF